jgi:hypothetical protein
MSDEVECPGCRKTKPQIFCWENRDWNCPLGVPPRWATESTAIHKLWAEVRRLRT